MRPVTQTDTSPTSGNCFQAALASILDLPLEEVPHFVIIDGPEWWDEVQAWLRDRFDLQIVSVEADGLIEPFRGLYIITGISARGVWHSIVYKDGRAAPRSVSRGLGVEPKHALLFVALNPARARVPA